MSKLNSTQLNSDVRSENENDDNCENENDYNCLFIYISSLRRERNNKALSCLLTYQPHQPLRPLKATSLTVSLKP